MLLCQFHYKQWCDGKNSVPCFHANFDAINYYCAISFGRTWLLRVGFGWNKTLCDGFLDELKREREFYRSRGVACPKDIPVNLSEMDGAVGEEAKHTESDYHRLDEQVNHYLFISNAPLLLLLSPVDIEVDTIPLAGLSPCGIEARHDCQFTQSIIPEGAVFIFVYMRSFDDTAVPKKNMWANV